MSLTAIPEPFQNFSPVRGPPETLSNSRNLLVRNPIKPVTATNETTTGSFRNLPRSLPDHSGAFRTFPELICFQFPTISCWFTYGRNKGGWFSFLRCFAGVLHWCLFVSTVVLSFFWDCHTHHRSISIISGCPKASINRHSSGPSETLKIPTEASLTTSASKTVLWLTCSCW